MRLTLALLLSGFFMACASTKPPPDTDLSQSGTPVRLRTTAKVRSCPDGWFDDAMPGPTSEKAAPSEYMTYGGKRVEVETVDLDWVKQNCSKKSASRVE